MSVRISNLPLLMYLFSTIFLYKIVLQKNDSQKTGADESDRASVADFESREIFNKILGQTKQKLTETRRA